MLYGETSFGRVRWREPLTAVFWVLSSRFSSVPFVRPVNIESRRNSSQRKTLNAFLEMQGYFCAQKMDAFRSFLMVGTVLFGVPNITVFID